MVDRLRSPDSLSLLGSFMCGNNISAYRLAAYSGLSVRHIGALRYGKSSPTLRAMKRIGRATSEILGRRVSLGELFDLDYDEAPPFVTTCHSN